MENISLHSAYAMTGFYYIKKSKKQSAENK